ncbi:MAG: glycosyltransferase [Acidobacteria bacterium]|nr:glycosyltransferase [Acidobacteriota bacterium]
MKIVVFGLSISSAWGNGHATTFRALLGALRRRGHEIVFYEKDVEWYGSNRDLPSPECCRLRLYSDWEEIIGEVRKQLSTCDAAVVGSYFPDGIVAIRELFESGVSVKTFYDIDTPITIAGLRQHGETPYLKASHVAEFDVYFSFTGGPLLGEIQKQFGARRAVPLYCAFDPRIYRRFRINKRFACDLSYMGTYAPDRQAKLEQLLLTPAQRCNNSKFIVAGPQYPKDVIWPRNVRRIVHLNPRWHARFYSSSRLTLNVTRREMIIAGHSPSVRLFEAAACGAAIVSDNWPGLDSFFKPGREILLPLDHEDVIQYLSLSDSELRRIGNAAQERVLAEHTSEVRAGQFEDAIAAAASGHTAQRVAMVS